MPDRLAELATDRPAALRFGRRAIDARAGEGREPVGWSQAYEERLASGAVEGRLYVADGTAAGLVCWSAGGPLGVTVNLLYATEGPGAATRYARILELAGAEAGPVAFVCGPLAGLAPEAEDRLMRPFGFQRYGRSEMLLAPGASLPDAPSVLGEEVRPARQDDLGRLAELHREAYRARFDRYLFLEVEDEREDALRAVAEILDGRWGEFLPAGSWIVERAGRPVGAVLSVRSGTGTLIADVMVVPELQGNGVGRRALAAAVRSLRDAGEQRVYLNVTEGNEPALRLYRRFGFVRSLGPTRDWYNARLIPIAPAQGA